MTVALIALATLVPLASARLDAQREREKELLFGGRQIAAALARYYDASPGAKQYPAALADLLEDRRFPQPRRHLRRLYRDPMTADGEWQFERVQGRIVALHSASTSAPLKRAGFPAGLEDFERAGTYAQWRFAASNGRLSPLQTGVSGPPTGDPAAPPTEPTPPGQPPQPPLDAATRCLQLYVEPLERQCGHFLPASPRDYRACAAALSAQFQQCLREAAGGR